jgi:hypothetical protein
MSGKYFKTNLNIEEMIRKLRKQMPDINWRIGDSEYDNFYIRGKTAENIKIKITEEGKNEFYLGIYFYSMKKDIDEKEKQNLKKKYLGKVLKILI